MLTRERICAIIYLENDDGIWELRPGFNRVLYFYYKDDTFVLLHQFRKQTRKTPRQEIEKAKRERNDWIERKESEDENLG